MAICKDGQSTTSAEIPFAAGILVNNTGLKVRDTDASHKLSITPGSNLTADRIFTLTTGDAARTLDMSAGNLTAGGGQYVFPATQNASADANTLDDYEEGTWTPTLGDGTNNYTLSVAEGSYTKVGNKVTAVFAVQWTSIGSAGGTILILGALPFSAGGSSNAGYPVTLALMDGFDFTATLNPIQANGSQANPTQVRFRRCNDNANQTDLPANGSSATGKCYGTVVYFV